MNKILVMDEILGSKTVSMLYFLYLLFTHLIKNIRPKDKTRHENACHMGRVSQGSNVNAVLKMVNLKAEEMMYSGL